MGYEGNVALVFGFLLRRVVDKEDDDVQVPGWELSGKGEGGGAYRL